jgi:predicted DNA-binding transcriptional regulator AlpA
MNTEPQTTAQTGFLPQLVREGDLARWLGVHKRTVLEWQKRGLLPRPIKFGPADQATKAWLIDDLRQWIAEKREAAQIAA